ncbi:hypothetical protein H2198_008801 [Neophaeococcomyces mojaviensis]|uniref:Uncharacterized protein n=1 Tax=Neophaeococcomyces mojaviensis TaxID=3383035 RepID=A0ACC2ZWF0_9EURO|nr:hypothetical protein H2198_008801 [Knufia sp. JES_112]
MPRLPPVLISQAARLDRHLPLLLRECRDLNSARNELRWMQEAVDEPQREGSIGTRSAGPHDHALASFVKRRARGEPIQYILGTQPFGELDIKCRPGVLIPRPETEVYTTELARIIQKVQVEAEATSKHCYIVDFCTGTGCIALLLHSLLKPPTPQQHGKFRQLRIRGFDISQHALRLSAENTHHNLELRALHKDAVQDICFEHLDLLALAQQPKEKIITTLYHKYEAQPLDLIVSNPPYISPQQYKPGGSTTKSVRKFEPKLALVPPDSLLFDGVDQADQFYAALIRIAVASRARLLVVEVGDTEQALRVRDMCRAHQEAWIEIWKDDNTVVSDTGVPFDSRQGFEDRIDARVVAMWFDPEWIKWRKQSLVRRN